MDPTTAPLKKTPSGFHPEGINELDEQFGAGYRVDHVVFHYSSIDRVHAGFRDGSDTGLHLRDERAWAGPDPFLPEYLPDGDWLVQRLTLLFDIGPERAREYVAQLRDAITSEQTDLPAIDISEAVTFTAVYRHLVQESTAIEGTHSQGTGWHIVTHVRDGTPFAEVGYRLQSTKYSTNPERGPTSSSLIRSVELASKLRFRLASRFRKKRRSVFREMFGSLGLPPALLEDVEFDYVGSMW